MMPLKHILAVYYQITVSQEFPTRRFRSGGKELHAGSLEPFSLKGHDTTPTYRGVLQEQLNVKASLRLDDQ
jgi:hypothetical protein